MNDSYEHVEKKSWRWLGLLAVGAVVWKWVRKPFGG